MNLKNPIGLTIRTVHTYEKTDVSLDAAHQFFGWIQEEPLAMTLFLNTWVMWDFSLN